MADIDPGKSSTTNGSQNPPSVITDVANLAFAAGQLVVEPPRERILSQVVATVITRPQIMDELPSDALLGILEAVSDHALKDTSTVGSNLEALEAIVPHITGEHADYSVATTATFLCEIINEPEVYDLTPPQRDVAIKIYQALQERAPDLKPLEGIAANGNGKANAGGTGEEKPLGKILPAPDGQTLKENTDKVVAHIRQVTGRSGRTISERMEYIVEASRLITGTPGLAEALENTTRREFVNYVGIRIDYLHNPEELRVVKGAFFLALSLTVRHETNRDSLSNARLFLRGMAKKPEIYGVTAVEAEQVNQLIAAIAEISREPSAANGGGDPKGDEDKPPEKGADSNSAAFNAQAQRIGGLVAKMLNPATRYEDRLTLMHSAVRELGETPELIELFNEDLRQRAMERFAQWMETSEVDINRPDTFKIICYGAPLVARGYPNLLSWAKSLRVLKKVAENPAEFGLEDAAAEIANKTLLELKKISPNIRLGRRPSLKAHGATSDEGVPHDDLDASGSAAKPDGAGVSAVTQKERERQQRLAADRAAEDARRLAAEEAVRRQEADAARAQQSRRRGPISNIFETGAGLFVHSDSSRATGRPEASSGPRVPNPSAWESNPARDTSVRDLCDGLTADIVPVLGQGASVELAGKQIGRIRDRLAQNLDRLDWKVTAEVAGLLQDDRFKPQAPNLIVTVGRMIQKTSDQTAIPQEAMREIAPIIATALKDESVKGVPGAAEAIKTIENLPAVKLIAIKGKQFIASAEEAGRRDASRTVDAPTKPVETPAVEGPDRNI